MAHPTVRPEGSGGNSDEQGGGNPTGTGSAMLPTRWTVGGLHGVVWSHGAALLDRRLDGDLVDRFWPQVRRVRDLGDFVNTLAECVGAGLLGLPDFAVAVLGPDRQVQVAARGELVAYVLAETGDETVSGAGVDTWTERVVPDARAVVLQHPDVSAVAVTRSIQSGVVPASVLAFALSDPGERSAEPLREQARRVPVIETGPSPVQPIPVPSSPAPATAPQTLAAEREPSPDPGSAPSESADTGRITGRADGGGAAVVAEPSVAVPLVNAVLCAQGHANPPQRPTCRVCGAELVGATVRIERPSVGRLFVDDQHRDLIGPVIVGRAPRAARFRGQEVPTLLTVGHSHVSANHLALRLDGWHVLLQDLGSTNGTFLRRAGDAPIRVSEEPVLLVPGDVVDLGHGVVIAFEDLA